MSLVSINISRRCPRGAVRSQLRPSLLGVMFNKRVGACIAQLPAMKLFTLALNYKNQASLTTGDQWRLVMVSATLSVFFRSFL